MNTPQDRRIVLAEPGVTRSDVGIHVLDQLSSQGYPIDSSLWDRTSDPEIRFKSLVAPILERSSLWGIKEVNPAQIEALVRQFQPKKILICVRDPYSAAFSIMDLYATMSKNSSDAKYVRSEYWMWKRMIDAADMCVKLLQQQHETPTKVVPYEKFATDEQYRQSVANWVGWPLDGDPNAIQRLHGRSYEIQRHGSGIGTPRNVKSLRGIQKRFTTFARRTAACMNAFANSFGYKNEIDAVKSNNLSLKADRMMDFFYRLTYSRLQQR